MNKLQKISTRGIAVIGCGIFLCLLYCAWRYTATMYVDANEKIIILRDSPLRLAAALTVMGSVGGFIFFLAAKCSAKATHLIALVCTGVLFVAMLLFLFGAGAYPVADQWSVYQGALMLREGMSDFGVWSNYFHVYPHQLGLSQLYRLVMQISGSESWVPLQVVNVLCACLAFYTGYLITRELFDERGAELLYLFSALLFLPMYVFTLFVYGDTIGLCAAAVGILFFLRANRESNTGRQTALFYLGAALSLALMYLARSALVIVWIALVIVQALYGLGRKKIWRTAVMAAMILVMFGVQNLCIALAGNRLGEDFGDGMPMSLWLVMSFEEGMGEGSVPGGYNGRSWTLYVESGYDRELSSSWARDELSDRFTYMIEHPAETFDFFKRKMLCQWIEPSYGCFTMTSYLEDAAPWVDELYSGDTQTLVYGMLDSYQSALYFVICIYLIMLLKGEKKTNWYLPALILVGELFFSAIWETKSRYVYPYMFLIMPCIGGTLNIFFKKISFWLTKRKRHITI